MHYTNETIMRDLLSAMSYELQNAIDESDRPNQLRLSSAIALLQHAYEMYVFGRLPVNMAATTPTPRQIPKHFTT